MRVWNIPVEWEMCGIVSIEAETLEEAVEKAEDDPYVEIPPGEYIDCSFRVPDLDVEEIRDWYNDGVPDSAEEETPDEGGIEPDENDLEDFFAD